VKETTIRKATVEDVTVIHRLLSELETSLGATSKIKRKAEDLGKFGFSDDPLFEALIARNGAEAVGLALYFREFSTWLGQPGVYVQDLYVAPSQRGTGLGSKLMQAVYDRARGWSAAYCKLMVHADNEAAIAFYKRLGFHVVNGEHVLIHKLQ
jgi:ribosomal protein S18 acetylase RimI-like enzyme